MMTYMCTVHATQQENNVNTRQMMIQHNYIRPQQLDVIRTHYIHSAVQAEHSIYLPNQCSY